MKIWRTNKFTFGAAIALLVTLAGCGHWPASPASLRDIAHTSASEYHINASSLNSKDFPALAKFTRLYEIDFNDDGGTDEKLNALAQVGFTNLAQVVVVGCPRVTDQGVASLARIPSIIGLGLRGTSISDKSIEIMTAMTRLQEVSLEGSTNVTMNGLLALMRSETIESVSFSCGNLGQGDLVRIIDAARHIKRIDIGDPPEGRLDAPALRKAAEARSIKLYMVHDMVCSPL